MVFTHLVSQFTPSVVSDSLPPHGLEHASSSVLYLLEFAQTHAHWAGDAIQPFHLLSSPSLPAFYLSQHQDLFQWVVCSYQAGQSIEASASASVLPMNIQDWSLAFTGLFSLQSKGLSSLLQHHNLKASILQCSAFLGSDSHICKWLLEKP